MVNKTEILKLIGRLPDDLTPAEVMEELYFAVRVARGLKDAAEGRVLSHTEMKDRIARWRIPAGR